jgi:DNA-binding NtrC family response regulator
MKKSSILLIDDDDSLRRVIEFSLIEAGYRVDAAPNGEEGLRLFAKGAFDAVITDITMPGMSGMEVLDRVLSRDSFVPVIVITAYGTIESAVQAMRQGAFDYITKPFNRDELRLTLEKALKMRRLERENTDLRAEVVDRHRFSSVVGHSEKMKAVLDMAGRVAGSDATVLITGESGTGKEVLAKSIHFNSTRADGPFVAVNCAAIPETLIESELFGHAKGAFTGAIRDVQGKFEQADGGTLFLDEIADLRIDLQAKLLRVLQERRVEPLGGGKPLDVDVRIVAATNRDVEAAVKQGTFREDLFYRLSVITLHLPPLRERREDIQLLVAHFLNKFNKDSVPRIDAAAEEALRSYAWPGNVRELENAMERASVLKHGDAITLQDLPQKLSQPSGGIESLILNLPEKGISLEELEKSLIVKALEKHNNNQTRAAEYLGITRPTLIYRMEKYGLK